MPRSPIPAPQIPLIPPEIPPRQAGESAYDYRTRRTLALYGQTPYQRRLWLASQRGIGTSAGRGHGRNRVTGETESQRRNRIAVQNTGSTVSQNYRATLRQWLISNGYTPQTTLMSWSNLLRLAPRLRAIQTMRPDAPITPDMIYNAVELEQQNELDKGWAFDRTWRRYDDTITYRIYSDRDPGRESWYVFRPLYDYIPEDRMVITWWYYH